MGISANAACQMTIIIVLHSIWMNVRIRGCDFLTREPIRNHRIPWENPFHYTGGTSVSVGVPFDAFWGKTEMRKEFLRDSEVGLSSLNIARKAEKFRGLAVQR